MKEILKIKTDKPVQENFLGVNAVYHCYATQPDNRGREYSEELCEIEFDRAKECGLKIARTFYGWYAYDFEKGVWDWESVKMRGFYKWADAMQKRGIDIAIQAGWNSPGDINSTSWNGESPFTVEGDWDKSVQNYAKWVSESLHQLVEVRGFTNVKYLMMFTEPQNGAGKLPEGKTAYDCWIDASRAVHEQLVKDGRRHLVKMVGPDEGSTTTSNMLHYVAERCDDFMDVYTSHNYISSLKVTEEDVHTGNYFVLLEEPIHARTQQKVILKPNTDYEMSIWIRLRANFDKPIDGYMLMGAFDLEPGWPFFKSVEPASRINAGSTRRIDVSELSSEYRQFKFQFNTENSTECYIGFLYNVFQKGSTACVDDVSLKEVGSDVEILKNPSFEEYSNDWMHVGYGERGVDTYRDWSRWVEVALQYVPEGKQYWYDEYNWNLSPSNVAEENTHLMQDKTRGVEIAQAQTAFINHGLQSSLLWTLFDQQWPDNFGSAGNNFHEGDHRWGIMPKLSRTLVPYPAYYAYTLVARYLGGGEGVKAFEGTTEGSVPNLHLCATQSPNGDICVLVVNKREKEAEFTIDLGSLAGHKFNRRLYNPLTVNPTKEAKLIDIDRTFDGEISDTIPAGSFAVYTTRED